MKTNIPPSDNIKAVMDNYGNMLFRLCLVTLGNSNDAEDALQETMIKYIQKKPDFKDKEHEKAWLIKVASNKCKDILRFRNNHPVTDIEEMHQLTQNTSDCEIIDALMALPEKYKTVLILHYVEGFNVNEIARIIEKTSSAVKMRLQKGRRLLEEIYRKEYL